MTCGINTKGPGEGTFHSSFPEMPRMQTDPLQGRSHWKAGSDPRQPPLQCVFAEHGSQAVRLGGGPGLLGLHRRRQRAECSVHSPWVWGCAPRPAPSLWTPLTPAHPRPLCGAPGRVTCAESHAVWAVCPASHRESCVQVALVRVLWPSGSPLCAGATLLTQPRVRGRPDGSRLWL